MAMMNLEEIMLKGERGNFTLYLSKEDIKDLEGSNFYPYKLIHTSRIFNFDLCKPVGGQMQCSNIFIVRLTCVIMVRLTHTLLNCCMFILLDVLNK